MKTSRFTDEQIVQALRQTSIAGVPLSACRSACTICSLATWSLRFGVGRCRPPTADSAAVRRGAVTRPTPHHATR
jgi:hypothetical protein